MIINLYNIKDALTGFKEQIFTAVNDAEAIRAFSVMANNEGTYVNAYAKDIDLFRVGSMDSKTGTVTGIKGGPEFLRNAKAMQEAKEKN